MKICPSCSAELDDKEARCPICDYAFDKTIAQPAQSSEQAASPADVTSKLAEMRAKIEKLSRTGPTESIPTKKEEEVPVPEKLAEKTESPPPIEAPIPLISEKKEVVEQPSVSPTVQPSEKEPEPSQTVTEAEPQEEGTEEEEVEYEEVIIEEVHKIQRPSKFQRPETIARKITADEAKVSKKSGIGKRQAVIAVVLIVIILFSSWYLIVNRQSGSALAIDGLFADWEKVAKYESYSKSDDSNLNFIGTAVQYDSSKLYWYFETSGDLYKTSDHVTGYALLVDTDGDTSTGYSVNEDFGADMMVRILGSGGQLSSASTLNFIGSDRLNWSSWQEMSSISIATINKQLETSFSAPSSFSPANARFVSVSFDGVAQPSWTIFYSLLPGVLLIKQSSLIPASGVLSAGSGQEILQLEITAYGKDIQVQSMTPVVTGVSSSSDLGQIIWQDEQEMKTGRTFTVRVNCSSASAGTLVTAKMARDSFVTDYPSVMILGKPAIGYVTAIPSGHKIDGCFSDWTSFANDIDDVITVPDKSVDITRTSENATTSNAYFYIEVSSGILSGSFLPVQKEIIGPGGGSGGSSISKRITGEDVLRLYLDIDPAASSGAPNPLIIGSIRPEYMIEICGRSGTVTSKSFFEWTSGWTRQTSIAIDAANDANKIEMSFPKSATGSLINCSIAIVATSWIGANDSYVTSGAMLDPFKINLTGKIWGSLDGIVWTPKTDVLSNGNSLVDLTSDDSGNLYAIFSNGTVYISTDAAMNWSRFASGILINIVAITTDRSSELYAMASNGNVFNMPITGGSWAYRGDAQGTGYADFDWVNGTTPATTTLYAVKSTPNSNLFRTADGGATWSSPPFKPPTDTTVCAIGAIKSGSQDVVYVLEEDGDIRISNDSVGTWTSSHISAGGSSDFVSSACVDLDIDSSGNVWIVRSKGEVYRLTVISWSWETLYSGQDSSQIASISAMPIPEFSNIGAIAAFSMVFPIIFIARKRYKMA